jgi:hypothetical protein
MLRTRMHSAKMARKSSKGRSRRVVGGMLAMVYLAGFDDNVYPGLLRRIWRCGN